MKDVTLMVGESDFVVDPVLASLAWYLDSEATKEKYDYDEHLWMDQV